MGNLSEEEIIALQQKRKEINDRIKSLQDERVKLRAEKKRISQKIKGNC